MLILYKPVYMHGSGDMRHRPSFFVSAILFVALLFVLGALLTFFIKLAFFALLLAAAYYLYSRASRGRRGRRDSFHRYK